LGKLKDFTRKGDVKNAEDTANRIATKGRALNRMARKYKFNFITLAFQHLPFSASYEQIIEFLSFCHSFSN
jgi:hypothetical protein